MLSGGVVLVASLAYLGLLFAIAYYGDKRAEAGKSLTRNPIIYALSIAVYCTSWTFYGSVGRAATSGLDFLPIYLGPTLVFVLWSVVLVKIVRICKVYRITSIADFISSRYGKSAPLGGLVAIIAVIGTTPYISLQLKSIANSFATVVTEFRTQDGGPDSLAPFDTTLLVALVLAAFSILFGTRHIDASERHDGLVAAIAFESIVKLFAFLTVGLFVTFGLYNGFGDLFDQARAQPDLAKLMTAGSDGSYMSWITMAILSMTAIFSLPRQFHITAVEVADEAHLRKAVWLFPLYLLLINLFVLPIALGGRMTFGGSVLDADMFVLSVPLHHGQGAIALIAFIGGLSAATSMVIVATIALSTMVSNNLVMPLLFRSGLVVADERSDLSSLLLSIRRASIVAIMMLGYGYFHFASESYSLVTIGLVSFAAAAQFAPAIIGGLFWKQGTCRGAFTGLILGFAVWLYTLLLPSFAQSGWLPIRFLDYGPWGIEFLRPYALFGLDGFDSLTHALFWSMLFNVGGYVLVSLRMRQGDIDRIQSALFVDVFEKTEDGAGDSRYWLGSATVADLQSLVGRFIGIDKAAQAFHTYALGQGMTLSRDQVADGALLDHAEMLMAGAVGSATARVMIGSVVKGEHVGLTEMYQILDETSQAIRYSRMLEAKSKELEDTTRALQAANERLKELDGLKDDFLSTISHELRTPLTSIRAFSEILSDPKAVTDDERQHFLEVISKESVRLTRLIDRLLDLGKMEAGRMDWSVVDMDLGAALDEGLEVMDGLIKEKHVQVTLDIPDHLASVRGDRDQLVQVIVNLLSNAIKFSNPEDRRLDVAVHERDHDLQVSIADNGPGVKPEFQALIFEKFHQLDSRGDQMPRGTGLGLAICRQIVTYLGGTIWVENRAAGGACFRFTVPLAR